MLDDHWEANQDPNKNAEQARSEDEQQGLVEVKSADAVRCESDWAQHTNLFSLLVHIGSHCPLQREETEEHQDAYDDVKDHVEQVKSLRVCFKNWVLVTDLDKLVINAQAQVLNDLIDQLMVVWVPHLDQNLVKQKLLNWYAWDLAKKGHWEHTKGGSGALRVKL